MNDNILRERISKVNLAVYLTYATGWTMRVWRHEKVDMDLFHNPGQTTVDGDISAAIQRFTAHPATQLELARAILALERVNAVEVIDHAGFGEVLYKDWP